MLDAPASFVGDSIELSSFDGTRQVLVDGELSEADVAQFEQLAAGEGADYAVTGERLTETTWVVDVTPL